MNKHLTMAWMCLTVLALPVLADDVAPPPWSGGAPGSLFAEWDTWGGHPGLMAPDQWFHNIPHTVTAPVATGPHATSRPSVGEPNERFDVMEVTAHDGLMFHLDNWDQRNPEKLIRIQITYRSGGGEPIGFNVWPSLDPVGEGLFIPAVPFLIDPRDLQGEWLTGVYDFTMVPNPEAETIGLKFSDYPVFVDQVVIDTICVPEPASIALLAMGGLALLRKRE